MSERAERLNPRKWLLSGGGGYEWRRGGLRTLIVTGEELLDFLKAYAEDAAFAEQPRFQFSEEQVREWCQEFRDSGLKMDSAGLPGFLVEKLNGFRAP